MNIKSMYQIALLLFGLIFQSYMASAQVKVTQDGNVGIGTDEPGVKLDIVDDVAGGLLQMRLWNKTAIDNPAESQIIIPVFNGAPGLSIRTMVTTNGGFNEGHYDSFIQTGQASSKLHLSGGRAGNAKHLTINSNGYIGIGTASPGARLEVYFASNGATISKNAVNAIRSTYTSTNVTSYDKAGYAGLVSYEIPAGITDSGYKIGLDASAYSSSESFAGTLNKNTGIWARAGIFSANNTATLTEAVSVEAEILGYAANITNAYGVRIRRTGVGANIDNLYDLYAATPSAKNYFAGNVGIGTTDPHDIFSVQNCVLISRVGNSNRGRISIGTGHVRANDENAPKIVGISSNSNAPRLRFDLNNTDVMTLHGNGNVEIGKYDPTSPPSHKLEVNGGILASGAISASCGMLSCSDIRYKKNFQPIQNTLAKIDKLDGIYYDWNQEAFPDKNFDDKTYIGVKAQELEAQFPELVHTDQNGYKSVDYARLSVVLLEAVKEQQKQIGALETKNEETLKNNLNQDQKIKQLFEIITQLTAEQSKESVN